MTAVDLRAAVTAAVVLGAARRKGIAARAQAGSARDVLALWYVSGGVWLYSVPSVPGLDGGVPDQIDRDALSVVLTFR